MKKIFIMMFGLLFAVSTAFASPTAKGDMVVMNKADSQFLFNGKANVIALNNEEMIKTEGELIPFIVGAYNVYRYTRWAIGPLRSWIRIGRSYSKSGGYKTFSLRWGSNSYYKTKHR
jgi:hypothetical protein